MGRHTTNLKVLKNIDVVSTSSDPSTASPETHEVIYPTKKSNTKTKKKKTKKNMSDFFDAFRKSYSSATPSNQEHYQSKLQEKTHTVYAEIQILKVTAPKQDLEKFAKEVSRIKETVGIGVDVAVMLPSREYEERLKKMEEREKANHDFLDYMFSDTIPFLHDFLLYGSPESQFYKIRGRQEGDLDIFNKLCRQMIFGTELQCKLEITERRKIPLRKQIKNSIFGGPNSKPDLLDAIFSDDLSSCNPFLHNLLLSVY